MRTVIVAEANVEKEITPFPLVLCLLLWQIRACLCGGVLSTYCVSESAELAVLAYNGIIISNVCHLHVFHCHRLAISGVSGTARLFEAITTEQSFRKMCCIPVVNVA